MQGLFMLWSVGSLPLGDLLQLSGQRAVSGGLISTMGTILILSLG